jgi:putative ABC transport system permease protein
MNWLRALLRRSAVEREMDAEMRFHIEELTRRFEAQGMSSREAQRQARMEFGGLEQVKDDAREARMAGTIERNFRELRAAGCRPAGRPMSIPCARCAGIDRRLR